MNRSTRLGGKTIHYHSYLAHVLSIRIPVKIVVTELEDHSRAILTSTDTQLSGERLIQYDSLRWSIESFFKFAKQNLSLSKCQIRSEQAQKHYMILVSIAYLIFNDLMEIAPNEQKERASSQNILRDKSGSFHFGLNIHLSRFYGHF